MVTNRRAVGRAASMPVAWMCPLTYGEIQTSVHAGGMASFSMRARISASATGPPSGSR
jgi:hypothetical protein